MALLVAGLPCLGHAGIDAWTTTGPRVAWTVHYHDPHHAGRVFIGLPGQKALYRSSNGGGSFENVLQLASFNGSINTIVTPSIVSVASDPENPAVVWAGDDTGRIYRSLGFGKDWTHVSGSIQIGSPAKVAVAPWGTGDVFAIQSGTLVRKRAAEETFVALAPAWDFAPIAARPGTLVLVDAMGAARSIDHGSTWMRLNGLPASTSARVVGSPMDPERLYAVVRNAASEGQVYRSDDGGTSWSPASVLAAYPTVGNFAADPWNRDGLFALVAGSEGRSLLRSQDAGASFQALEVPGGAPRSFSLETGSGLCLTNTTGLLCSRDHGARWSSGGYALPGDGLDPFSAGSLWTDLVVAHGQPGYVVSRRLGVSQAFGTNAWHALSGPAAAAVGDQGEMRGVTTIHGSDLASSSATLRSTSDGGLSFSDLRPVQYIGTECSGLVVAPSNPARLIRFGQGYSRTFNLYIAGCLAVSHDGGQTFVDLATTGFNANGEGARTVVFDPTDANVAWLAKGDELWRSADGGLTWTPDLGGVVATSLAIDPADRRKMLVQGFSEGTYTSEDGGVSWTIIPPPAPSARGADVDWRAAARTIYVATETGVFAVAWGSTAWQRVDATTEWKAYDLKVARAKGTDQRATIFVTTSEGIHVLTLSSALAFVPVYRFYNTRTGAHFYTANAAERDFVNATYPEFVDEGERFRVLSASAAGTIPVYRFFNTWTGVHFYTADEAEKDHVIATWPQFAFEGIAYHAFRADPGTSPTHRFFNTLTGTHFYTTSDDEALTVQQNYPQFAYEGIRWAVYPAAP